MTSIELTNGHLVEVYEPTSSGVESMMRGVCPGCGESTASFTGRYGCIRELDGQRRLVTSGEFTTSYGHLTCVEELYRKIASQVTQLRPECTWWHGRQRDVLEAIHAHPNEIIEVMFVPGRGRTERYDYRPKKVT